MLLMYVCVFIFYEDAESEYTYAESNRYNDYSTAFQGQKISAGRTSSPGQRLVIALVSLVLLALMTFGVISVGFLANVGLTGGFLFLILLVCFYAAVVIINVVFNRGGYM